MSKPQSQLLLEAIQELVQQYVNETSDQKYWTTGVVVCYEKSRIDEDGDQVFVNGYVTVENTSPSQTLGIVELGMAALRDDLLPGL